MSVNLINDLVSEAWALGHDEALYRHAQEIFHTEKKRKAIQNRKQIVEGIKNDLVKLIKEVKP